MPHAGAQSLRLLPRPGAERRFYRAKRGSLLLSLFVSSAGVLGAHGRAVQFEPDGAMNETVEDGVGQGGIVELAVPVGDRQLTGDDRRAVAEAVVEDFEEVTCPRGVDRRQTPVVEDEQLDAGEVAVELRDGALSHGRSADR